MQAESASAHLLFVWVGCTTSAMGSGILESLAQTHDTAWGYPGLSSSQCSPPQPLCCKRNPGQLLLVARVLAGGRAGNAYLFGGPVSIPEEAAAAIAALEGRERGAEQEAQHEIPYTFDAESRVCLFQPNSPSLT